MMGAHGIPVYNKKGRFNTGLFEHSGKEPSSAVGGRLMMVAS